MAQRLAVASRCGPWRVPRLAMRHLFSGENGKRWPTDQQPVEERFCSGHSLLESLIFHCFIFLLRWRGSAFYGVGEHNLRLHAQGVDGCRWQRNHGGEARMFHLMYTYIYIYIGCQTEVYDSILWNAARICLKLNINDGQTWRKLEFWTSWDGLKLRPLVRCGNGHAMPNC